MSSEAAKTILNQIKEDKPLDVKKSLNATLWATAAEKIKEMKAETAKTLFNKVK